METSVVVVDFLKDAQAVLLDGVLLVAAGPSPAETEQRVSAALSEL
jgi:hypothetical protein